MATETRLTPVVRKQVLRQNALNECLDISDGCSAIETKSAQTEAKRQPDQQTNYPVVTDVQSSKQRTHPLKCHDGQNDEKSSAAVVNSTKCPNEITNETEQKDCLSSCCNEELEYYRYLLLKRRNTETMYYDHSNSFKRISLSKQATTNRIVGRKDYCDGIPFSSPSEAIPASHKREQFAAVNKKDFSDVLPSKQNSARGPHKDANLDGISSESNSLKISQRISTLDSCNDEGFENGDLKRRSLSHSSSLTDIQENKSSDYWKNTPRIKLNSVEKSLSETGRQKGEGFRQSKKSSGYGTGGSEETIPDEDCLSSVFLSAENACNEDNGQQLLETTFHHEQMMRYTVNPLSSDGKRILDIKDSSLPKDARIWDINAAKTVKVPSHVKERCRSNMTPSESDELWIELMTANPHRKIPNLTDLHKLDEAIIKTDKACSDMLSSQLFGDLRAEEPSKNIPLTTKREDNDYQLLISDESEPSLNRTVHEKQVSNGDILNGTMHEKQVSNGDINGIGSDTIDGGSCLNVIPKMTALQQPVTNGHITSSHRDHSISCYQPQKLDGYYGDRLYECLERAIFCQNRYCKDSICQEGRRNILQLHHLFERGRLQDCNPKVFEYLWLHSETCKELQCIVPFCDEFHKRPLFSFREHYDVMTKHAFKWQLSREFMQEVQEVLQNGEFRTLDDNGSLKYALWKTSDVVEENLIGDFCDFNISRVRVRFHKESDKVDYIDVIIKKEFYNDQNVYFTIKNLSPYLVHNYWCSELQDSSLLVCSIYHKDLISLQTYCQYHGVTIDHCLAILEQAILAAKYLHSLNVVYLNWKCASLLFDKDNKSIKLCNFSRAVILEHGLVIKSPEIVKNTIDPRFAAPEVLCGEPLGFYSDVWGIGCLLYEMVTRNPPYPEHCHKSPAVIREMVYHNQIDHTYPGNNAKLLKILCDCWGRKPADRMSIDDMLKFLQDSDDAER